MVTHRTKKSQGPEDTSPLNISNSERWRIVRDSGVLDRENAVMQNSTAMDGDSDTADEIFNAFLYIIPFSFLYLMMDILTQLQYGNHPSPREYAAHLASAVPVLSLFIFYTNRHKTKRVTHIGLFLTSVAVGMRLIWLVNKAPWHMIIRQGPPLATIWIFTIAILNLLPAVAALCLVAAWVWWYEMKIVF